MNEVNPAVPAWLAEVIARLQAKDPARRFQSAAEVAVRRRYRTAALADMGVNRYGATDRYRLARSPIQRGDGMRWFRHKATGGLALEDTLRRLVNRGRYAGPAT